MKNDAKNGYKKFKQVIDVIRKYQNKKRTQDIIGNQDTMNFNILPFTLDLLSDYYENGLYSNDKIVIEENGVGEILWEKTINEENVYFSENIPLYLNYFTVNAVVKEDLFSRLHKCILTKSCNEILDILDILEIASVKISSDYYENSFNNIEIILKPCEFMFDRYLN